MDGATHGEDQRARQHAPGRARGSGMPEPGAEYEDTAQTAARLGVSADWVRRLCAEGRMPGAIKWGRDWKIVAGSRPVAGTRGARAVWDERVPGAGTGDTKARRMMDGGALLPREKPPGVSRRGFRRLVEHVRDGLSYREISRREGDDEVADNAINVQRSAETAARKILEYLGEDAGSRPGG